MAIEPRVRVLLVSLAALAVLYAYGRAYRAPPSVSGLAAASVSEFRPEYVRAFRVPYVLREPVRDPDQLWRTIFRFAYLLRRVGRAPAGRPLLTRSAYTVLLGGDADVDVDLTPPGEVEKVALSLRAAQVLVVPPHWTVTAAADLGFHALDDATSLLGRVL